MSRNTVDLTEESIKEFREAFALFDTDGDGTITPEELGAFMQCMGLSPTASEIARMIDEVDADGSGVIDFSEFVTLMARKVNNADKDEEIRAAFDIFDKDKSGKITCVELRAIMRALGDHLTDTEIDRMIREADSNGDGEIEFAEFKRMLS